MKATYEEGMEAVYEWEGGYTNQKGDKGGPTEWGITIDDARHYWKPDATADDVRAMPKSVAADIYARHYALPLRYDDLPAGVDLAVLDYGINSGIHRSAVVLQSIVQVRQDGIIGPDTLAAVNARPSEMIIRAIYAERIKFLRGLALWPVDGHGWNRRCNEGLDLCLSLAKRYPKGPTVTTTTTPAAPINVDVKIAELEYNTIIAIRDAVITQVQAKSPMLAMILSAIINAELKSFFGQPPTT